MGGMINGFNQQQSWNVNNYNFNFNLNLGGTTSLDQTSALGMLQAYFMRDQMVRGGFWGGWQGGQVPSCGCMPSPQVGLSGAPAGRGLQTGEKGWPEGTVTTAGGYHVVPQGNTNWAIFGPGQNAGDTPNTKVWGDPHVNEKDGTRWDFTGTKGLDGQTGNDFVLPDGTRIFAKTSADHGHSVTTGLEIANGADHVSIDGVNGSPKTGAIQGDGYEWRAQHVAAAGDRASFHLAGDNDNQHWVRERHGQMEGVITGTKDVGGSYDQTVDANLMAKAGAGMRPAFGTPAWGNMLRSQIDDYIANSLSRIDPRLGVAGATAASYAIHQNDMQNQFGFGSQFEVLGALRDLLLSDNQYQRELRFGITANTRLV